MPGSLKGFLMGYAVFVGYILFTKIVVAPAARSANIPLLKDL